jgi:protein FAM50
MREEFERQKQILINETEKARPSANRFVGQNDSVEDSLKNRTVGLVHLEEFQQRRKELEEQKAREAARSNELKYVSFSLVSPGKLWRTVCWSVVEKLFRDETKKSKKRKKSARATLSFALDDEDTEGNSPQDMKGESANEHSNTEEPPVKRSKLKKNPGVDTSFLPDREREEAERRERERLRLEWLTMQEQAKKEDIEITYSYWDGSGHRKTVSVSLFYTQKYLTL